MTQPPKQHSNTAIGKDPTREGKTSQAVIDKELALAELEKAEHKAIEYERYKFLKRVADLNKRHKIVFITHVTLRINHPTPTHLLPFYARWFVAFMKWLRNPFGPPNVEAQVKSIHDGNADEKIKQINTAHDNKK